jgi:hypothetical protein
VLQIDKESAIENLTLSVTDISDVPQIEQEEFVVFLQLHNTCPSLSRWNIGQVEEIEDGRLASIRTSDNWKSVEWFPIGKYEHGKHWFKVNQRTAKRLFLTEKSGSIQSQPGSEVSILSAYFQESAHLQNLQMDTKDFVKKYSKGFSTHGAAVPVVHGLLHLPAALVNHGSIQHYWAQSFENFNRMALSEVRASSRSLVNRVPEFVLEALRAKKVIPEVHRGNSVLKCESETKHVKKWFSNLICLERKPVVSTIGEHAIPTGAAHSSVGKMPVIEFSGSKQATSSIWIGGAMKGLLKRLPGESVQPPTTENIKFVLCSEGQSSQQEVFKACKSTDAATEELSSSIRSGEFQALSTLLESWFQLTQLDHISLIYYRQYMPGFYRSKHDAFKVNDVVRLNFFATSNVSPNVLPTSKTSKLKTVGVIRRLFAVTTGNGKAYPFVQVSPLRNVLHLAGTTLTEWKAQDSGCSLLELHSKVRSFILSGSTFDQALTADFGNHHDPCWTNMRKSPVISRMSNIGRH